MNWSEAIGKKFNKWYVVSDAGSSPWRKRLVNVRCQCGFERVIQLQNVTGGRSKGCCSCAKTGQPSGRKTHGYATKKPPEYRVWRDLKLRAKHDKVQLSDVWCGPDGFTSFFNEVGERPDKRYRLYRIDETKGYEPGNCRWERPHTSYSEWGIWWGILQRCTNPEHNTYPSYGGCGITVCDRWSGPNGWRCFLEDMGRRPSRQHSVDRIDNFKGYSPDNCRWATRRQQGNNQVLRKQFHPSEQTIITELARQGYATKDIVKRLINVYKARETEPENR